MTFPGELLAADRAFLVDTFFALLCPVSVCILLVAKTHHTQTITRPPWFVSSISWFKTVTGDLLKLTGIACVARITYFNTFLFSTATPIALAAVAFGAFLAAPRLGSAHFRRPIARGLAVFSLLVFPGISLHTLRMYVLLCAVTML
jgi:hypothetical protein